MRGLLTDYPLKMLLMCGVSANAIKERANG
jgi:hypothetical protein